MTNEERIVGLYSIFDGLTSVGRFDDAHKVINLISKLECRIEADNEKNKHDEDV